MIIVIIEKKNMLQIKEFACARQVKTVEDTALQNKQKGRIVTILSKHLFVFEGNLFHVL